LIIAWGAIKGTSPKPDCAGLRDPIYSTLHCQLGPSWQM
jgi:hypothetical protein